MLILKTLFQAYYTSVDTLRDRIHSVRELPLWSHDKYIAFVFYVDEDLYFSRLKGEDANLVLGFGEDKDREVAIRTVIHGNAVKLLTRRRKSFDSILKHTGWSEDELDIELTRLDMLKICTRYPKRKFSIRLTFPES